MAPNTSASILDKVEDLLLAKPKVRVTEKDAKRVLLISPEVAPYATVGGLSMVLPALAKALYDLGHDVRIFMPKFGFIKEEKYPLEMVFEGLKVPTDSESKPFLICNVKKHTPKGRPQVYMLENREYYELRENVYGYKDDAIRWNLLSRGALEFLLQSEDWIPDVIHANDWPTGAVVNYLKTKYKDTKLASVATVYTIHNLMYQGMFDHKMVSDLDYDDGKSEIAGFFNERIFTQNFMRRGILYADVVSTVSPNYAKEIQKPRFGEGLDRLLTEVRAKVSGVLDGIDYEVMNPATDKLIPYNYDIYSLDKKELNKLSLQEEFDLTKDKNIPLFGYVGRIDDQKGLDILMDVIPPLLRDFNVQFVFVGGVAGGGNSSLAHRIKELQEQYPDKIGAHLLIDFELSHLIFAGSDVVVVPSRFEPCGLVPMEAMRYGAIPLVHAVGGMVDSVKPYDPELNEGFGFMFRNYDPYSLFAQIIRALEVYRNKPVWEQLIKRAMKQDNSWTNRALEYVRLYDKAIQKARRGIGPKGKFL